MIGVESALMSYISLIVMLVFKLFNNTPVMLKTKSTHKSEGTGKTNYIE